MRVRVEETIQEGMAGQKVDGKVSRRKMARSPRLRFCRQQKKANTRTGDNDGFAAIQVR